MTNNKKKEKAFDEISGTFLVLIFISIIVSAWIALQADISDSAGHGGLIYIIGPAFFGLIVFLLYIVSLFIFPKWKTVLGWSCLLISLVTGFIFMHIQF